MTLGVTQNWAIRSPTVFFKLRNLWPVGEHQVVYDVGDPDAGAIEESGRISFGVRAACEQIAQNFRICFLRLRLALPMSAMGACVIRHMQFLLQIILRRSVTTELRASLWLCGDRQFRDRRRPCHVPRHWRSARSSAPSLQDRLAAEPDQYS